MNFQAFVDDIRNNQWPVYGVEVYQNGSVLHQYGDTTEVRYPIYSATKTITSLAVGMAVDEGMMALDRCVLEDLPEWAVEQMGESQRRIYQPVTLKRLLTMSVAGYPFRPSGESWLLNALRCPLSAPEKPVFEYSNISAYLAGTAAACAVGENLYPYLNRKLFRPLEIIDPPCGFCPDGYFYGASHMELTVNELSRIGLLLANGGIFNGKRIVSEAYIKAATSIQQMNREGGYGYLIWKYRDGFSINGKWGQKCYILPRQGLMITYLAHMEHGSGLLKASMEKHLLGDE